MPARRILIAPDSFKGSASASAAAQAIAEGWRTVRAGDTLRLLPMADGGEGTLDAFETAVPDARRMPVSVQGPDGRPVDAYWLLLPDETGVVELATTSGITLLDSLRPLKAHTLGFGQAIAAALDHGVRRLLLALGGSASTDGGVGALAALGATFQDATRRPVRLGNLGLGALARVNLSTLRALPPDGATILSDVTNPLLGTFGAASVFGAQKGANAAQVAGLESNLKRLARLVSIDAATPGAGAAGGTGYGLMAWGATTAAGASAIGAILGLPDAVAEADVVITGEGRFDTQSAEGKVPGYVAALAAESGADVMLVAGLIHAPVTQFTSAQSLSTLAGSSEAAMRDPLTHLRAAGAALAASR